MQAPRLDHVNIQTVRLAESVRFYADVLGLAAIDPPPPLDPALVQWVGARDGGAIFHLSAPGSLGLDATVGKDTGPVHHIALDCADHAGMMTRLDRLGIAHRDHHVAAIDLKQIFVTDPNGVLLELNYRPGRH